MKSIVFLLLLFYVGCSKPEQLPLSVNEKFFFKTLSEKLNCEVQRNIDVTLLGRFASKNKRGGYALVLYVDCERLKFLNTQKDSARKYASKIVSPLYKALENDPKYYEISISFTCKTSLQNSSKYTDMVYNYNVDSLNRIK